jgi:poly(3-hydroxyalkanoate) synthetase
MERPLGDQFPYAALLWPALAAMSAGEMASTIAAHLLGFDDDGRAAQEPEGVTPSKLALELKTVRLRDFSLVESGLPTLLCTPMALHGSTVADLADGHSLVAALRKAGLERLFMTDWRSASADMRFLDIDDYLAALNVLVDELGGRANLVGLCQGGWLSLVYAARFPEKVRKLVMAGTPVDIEAAQSELSAVALATPMAVFQSLVDLGDGRVIGRKVARFWGSDTVDVIRMRRSLQTLEPDQSPEFLRLEAIFKKWNSWTVDVPGNYYLEVTEKIYKRNELAKGTFVALGRKINLTHLQTPMYLLVGNADEVTAPEQLLAVRKLVGTRPERIRHAIADSDHLGLFMGKATLEGCWPRIVRWLKVPRGSRGEL